MRAQKSSSGFKNIFIIFCGLGLSFLIIFFLQNNPNLTASVLSLEEQEYMTQVSRDAGYKKGSGNLEIFITPQLQNHSALYLSLFFSPKLKILDGSIKSPYVFEILGQDATTFEIKITDFQKGNSKEGIITIPFFGEAKDITVESVRTSLTGESIALGYLDEIDL